jgi:hypothetical protein
VSPSPSAWEQLPVEGDWLDEMRRRGGGEVVRPAHPVFRVRALLEADTGMVSMQMMQLQEHKRSYVLITRDNDLGRLGACPQAIIPGRHSSCDST